MIDDPSCRRRSRKLSPGPPRGVWRRSPSDGRSGCEHHGGAAGAFYEAFFPRAEEAIAYCDGFPLADMPADAERLLQLLHSLLMVSYAVEVWRQPEVIHAGSARIDRILEPRP